MIQCWCRSVVYLRRLDVAGCGKVCSSEGVRCDPVPSAVLTLLLSCQEKLSQAEPPCAGAKHWCSYGSTWQCRNGSLVKLGAVSGFDFQPGESRRWEQVILEGGTFLLV